MQTAGRTVPFSAVTVAISLAALLIFPMFFLRLFAYAGIAVVVLALLGAIVVLPAMLAALGHRVDRFALRRKPPKEGWRGHVAPHRHRGDAPTVAGGHRGRRSWASSARRSSGSASGCPTTGSSRPTPPATWSRTRSRRTSPARKPRRCRSWRRARPAHPEAAIDGYAIELSALEGVARSTRSPAPTSAGSWSRLRARRAPGSSRRAAGTGRGCRWSRRWSRSPRPASNSSTTSGPRTLRSTRWSAGSPRTWSDSKAEIFGRVPLAAEVSRWSRSWCCS